MPLKSIVSRRKLILLLTISFFSLVSCLSLNIWLTRQYYPEPQAIFVLGGNLDRTKLAAQLWQQHPNLKIWVSDYEYLLEKQKEILTSGEVFEDHIVTDSRAVDTVTNFTTLVSRFRKNKIRHLYLVTSDYHMRRSRLIASIVLGSRGIVVTPVPVPSDKPTETLLRALRDGIRSIFWLMTGKTGAIFGQW